MSKITLGDMNVSIQIMERKLLPPVPGQPADPKHSYSPILTTRAAVKSHGGLSQFAQVSIDDKPVTHTFTIRYTTIPFDIRHRIRTATGKLYRILKVDDVDLANVLMRILASDQGLETVEAAR